MKNHEARPTGTAPFPEVNVARHNHYGKIMVAVMHALLVYAYDFGFDRGHNGTHKNTYFHRKWKNIEMNEKEGQSSKTNENTCHRCGGKGHCSRTPKHLIDLYKKSLKYKKERIETHFANEDDDPDYDNIDVTYLDIGDFFADPDGKIDHLIGDGIVKK
ncbi:uncharacterized protein LOC131637597 [Vicia villosa]|uniref:uncharacterized protein LOC131637597 n=1 Tax=Vicia villosa TaxID=3911 RepID=UPI00273B733E|nr:uncharacterized protein LOC131637597 [Vicia villosa]